VGKALDAVRMRNHYLPLEGSTAEAEWAQNRRFASDWGETPVTNAYSIAAMKLAAARDHVASLAQLLRPEPAPFATAALARVVLETSARAWWLLDPAIGPESRVARGMTDRLSSLRETLKMDLPEEMTAWHVSRVDRIHAGAIAKDFEPITNKSGRFEAIGERVPTATDLATLVVGGPEGELAYRDLSAASHGTLYALVSRMEVLEDPLGRHDKIARPKISMETVVPMVSVAVIAFGNAIDRELALYGWPRAEWEAWRREWSMTVLDLLPDG
jgi:hypothetical protein